MTAQRAAAVATAFMVEAVLILAVVFSTIGFSADTRPTPGGPAIPAPAASH
jgi:hypothetical protein